MFSPLCSLRPPTWCLNLFTTGLLLVVWCIMLTCAQRLDENELKELEKKMEEQGIKEIIDKPAEYLIDISYGHGKYVVKAGDKVDIEKVFEKPTNVSWDADLGNFYTLVLFDYDAPLRASPELRSFIHWMIGNIPERCLTVGKTFYDYYGLKLFEHHDVHRYVMLVYRQSGKITRWAEPVINSETFFPEWSVSRESEKTDALRAFFNRSYFEEKYKLGTPHAFTFFTSELGKS